MLHDEALEQSIHANVVEMFKDKTEYCLFVLCDTPICEKEKMDMN